LQSYDLTSAGRVSIIIPIHNRSRMLGHLLAATAAQTYHDIEILVVDDGSDDLSEQVFEGYRRQVGGRHPVRYLRKNKGGASSARNTGIASSSGDYLFFLDSDDLIFPNSIEILVSALRGSDEKYCVGRIIDVDFSLEQFICESHIDDPGNVLRSAEWCTHAALYRREAVPPAAAFNERLFVGEDTIFQIQMRLEHGVGARCPSLLGVRRRHAYGHLSLDRISPDDRGYFMIAASELLARHALFREEAPAVRLASTAVFLSILARIRHHRTAATDAAFRSLVLTLQHDSKVARAILAWQSARGANWRLVIALGIIRIAREVRSATHRLRVGAKRADHITVATLLRDLTSVIEHPRHTDTCLRDPVLDRSFASPIPQRRDDIACRVRSKLDAG